MIYNPICCVCLQIASTYGVDPSLTSVLDNMDIFLEIVTNPDGYAYTHNKVRLNQALRYYWL